MCADDVDFAASVDPRKRVNFASDVAIETGVPLFGSIAEALRVGGDTLAADAVMSIGEGTLASRVIGHTHTHARARARAHTHHMSGCGDARIGVVPTDCCCWLAHPWCPQGVEQHCMVSLTSASRNT